MFRGHLTDKRKQMKRILIEKPDLPIFPKEAAEYIDGAPVYDSSCSPEARVYFIDKDCGYYLKASPVGTLKKEAEMTDYFNKIGLSTEVIFYVQTD